MCNAVLKAMIRRVVCWVIGATMKGTLVLEALNISMGHQQIDLYQLLIHTVLGSQYRAAAYRQLLDHH
jgi:transposase InsO family protein